MRGAIASAMLALVATTGLIGQERPPRPAGALRLGSTATMSSEHLASAVALVTWTTTRGGSEGTHRLELLVVWRGQPGWWRGGGASGAGGGSGSTLRWNSRRGGVELRLDLDRATRIAHVQGERVELGDDNVLFVDDVDAPDGGTIVARFRVGPDVALAGTGRPDIDSLLLGSPEVMSFLRCEIPLPGGSGLVMGSTCAKASESSRPPER